VDNTEKKLFYAALFLSGGPLDMGRLRKVFDPFDLDNRLFSYAEEFNKLGLGLKIRAIAGGYQMAADEERSAALQEYFAERPESISKNALETLSIIAYRQPITKAEVEKVRGVDCSGSMKTLIDKGLIASSGRKDVPGRPLLYVTTPFFLEHFGLDNISELPTFREWQDIKKGTE
jgi:segregation and condensation protein B